MDPDNNKVIAFYLPQFHPTETNNLAYGPGFSEWTNVANARPLFPGHKQPNLPGALGFYDLRLVETQVQQAKLAKDHGVHGFCYYYYRFSATRHELDIPLKNMLANKDVDLPFMLCWANETWHRKMWNMDGSFERVPLAVQTYGEEEDWVRFFYETLPYLKDSRYIKISGMPAFMVYKSFEVPKIQGMIETWRRLAVENGLKGIYFIAQTVRIKEEESELLGMGFDAIQVNRLREYWYNQPTVVKLLTKIFRLIFRIPLVINYQEAARQFVAEDELKDNIYPTLIPNWDHTPRSGRGGMLLHHSTPEAFKEHAIEVLDTIKNKPSEQKIVFLMAWNEWAEGNYIEPDRRWGLRYLEALAAALSMQQKPLGDN